MILRSPLSAIAILCSLALPSCANYSGVFAPPSPAPGTRVNWPGVPFKEVRAYCYDYTAERASSFFVGGRMHRGVMDPEGVRLSPAQTQWLLRTLTVSQPAQERTACYKPHHAYVFYDERGGVAAVFEMCFGCNKFIATPPGVPEYIDKTGLYSLTRSLGLPLGKGDEFYAEACRRGRSQR